MAGAADAGEAEVAVIAGCPKGEALLREQHVAYGEEAAGSGSSVLLQQPNFLERNAAAIEANSGDYTSWYLRRVYLTRNPQSLNEDELRYCRGVCEGSLKNYQAWYHRQWLLRRLPASCFSLAEERDSLRQALGMDPKNYTTWSHRSFLAAAFSVSAEEEIEETEELLRVDPFSNSAFAYLFSRISEATKTVQPQQAFILWVQPIQRYMLLFEEQSSNESLVRFLLGCLDKAAAAAEATPAQQQLQELLNQLLETAARVLAAGDGGERFALEIGVAADAMLLNYRAAAAKCARLRRVDPMRRFYWSWRAMLFGKQDLAMQLVN